MRPMMIVPGQPSGQVGGTAIGGLEGNGVGPFPQHGLDEPLGLATGLERVGAGSDVPDAEPPQSLAEQAGDVARAVVGHDALDSHAACPPSALMRQTGDLEGGRISGAS